MKIFNVIAVLFILNACNSNKFSIAYFGQTPPKKGSQIFAPNLISVHGRFEQGLSFSPNGSELAFGVLGFDTAANCIYYTKENNGKWSKPEKASFIDKDSVFLPFFSPDGKSLFFTKSQSLPEYWMTDIWKVNKESNDWSEQIKLPAEINLNSREGSVGITKDGTIYFTSSRFDTVHHCCADVFCSKKVNEKYGNIVKMDFFETFGDNEGLYISPDENYLIIQSARNENGFQHDLYISYLLFDKSWSKPERLDSTINTTDFEQRPFVTFDNKYLFFSRMTFISGNPCESDIYWSSTKKMFKPYPFHPISDTIIITGNIFNFQLPVNEFKDVDGKKLKYEAQLAKGENLPEWLKFNAKDRTFIGKPTNTEELMIKIKAIDENLNIAYDEFKLVIKNK